MLERLKIWYWKVAVAFEFSAVVRERLYRKLSQLLKNGVTLDRALQQIASLENKKRGAMLGKLLDRWRRSIENGANFGQCVAPYVPSGEAILLEAGSNSGFLQTALETTVSVVSQQRRMKSKIISAAAYPLFLILVLIAILVLAAYNIFPTFEEVLPRERWIGISAIVANIAESIRSYGFLYFGTLFGIIVVVSLSLARWIGPTRMLVENLLPWSVYRMWQGATLMLSIASLMSAGVKLDENSLYRIAAPASPYLKERINALRRRISAGENLGDALDKAGHNFPNPEFIADLQIYATLKGFENNLKQITADWVDEVEENIARAMKVANTLALVLIAITISILGAALYGVVDQIQSQASGF